MFYVFRKHSDTTTKKTHWVYQTVVARRADAQRQVAKLKAIGHQAKVQYSAEPLPNIL